MKKFKISMILAVCLLIISISVVFAAFMFNQVVSSTARVGNISVDNKKFVNYQDSTYSNMRADTYIKADDIILESSVSYSATTDTTFQSGKTYYVAGTYSKASVTVGTAVTSNTYYEDKNGGYNLTSDATFRLGTTYYTKTANDGYTKTESVVIGTLISGTYYNMTETYTGVNAINTITYKDGTELTCDIAANKKTLTIKENTTTLLQFEVSFDSNGIAPIDIDDVTNPTETVLKAIVVDADGLGFVILKELSDTDKASLPRIDQASVICSATEEKQSSSQIYLNQLGFEFTFTNEVAAYARIHIQDAWTQIKEYSSTKRETYSIKDQIAGVSPFMISDTDWYYDEASNTAYLKTIILPVKDTDNNYISHTYSFDVNQAYYYISTNKSSIYTEYMDVEVSFVVDLVQANRAYELWGIDPSTLGD